MGELADELADELTRQLQRAVVYGAAVVCDGKEVAVVRHDDPAIFVGRDRRIDKYPRYELDYYDVVATRCGLSLQSRLTAMLRWLQQASDETTAKDRPVVGWRWWGITSGQLMGPIMRMTWNHEGWTQAQCKGFGVHPELPPAAHCHCGIYAYSSRMSVLDARDSMRGALAGLAALAGRIVPHERGWRAERSRPLVLVICSWAIRKSQLVEPMREVPILTLPEACELMQQGVSPWDLLGGDWRKGGAS